MSYRYPGFVLFLACSLAAVAARAGDFSATDRSSKELKVTAHRIRVSVERLKNIRSALQQATDLAKQMDPLPAQRMGYIGQLWSQLNRTKAVETIESLLEDVRRAAESAKDTNGYIQSCTAFSSLLQPLMELDREKAAQQAESWPNVPPDLGAGSEKLRKEQMDQFQRNLLQRLTYEDPLKAAKLYAELSSSMGADYSFKAQLAQQLAVSGQKDQAFKILDDVIADYQKQGPDQARFQDYTGFLLQVANIDPDRYMAGLAAISGDMSRPVSEADGAWTMRMGDRSLALSNAEYRVLEIVRSGFYGRPGLVMKTLDAFPDLKAKLDSFGGIDNIMNPSLASGSSVSFTAKNASAGGVGDSTLSLGFLLNSTDKTSAFLREVKSKSVKTPAEMRQKIEDSFNHPEDIDQLINLASRASNEEPDAVVPALEAAKSLVQRIQPLERRSQALQNLARAYRECEGEVDTDLLQDGFVLVDQLRQEETEGTYTYAAGNSPADQLEQFLVSEYASDHFEEGVRYIWAMDDDASKLAALLRVVETLRQGQ